MENAVCTYMVLLVGIVYPHTYVYSSFFHVSICDISLFLLFTDNRQWYPCPAPPAEKYFSPEPFSRAAIPGCRYGHTVCYYAGRLYMYGGRNDEDGSFSSVECYDLGGWARQCGIVSGVQHQSRKHTVVTIFVVTE